MRRGLDQATPRGLLQLKLCCDSKISIFKLQKKIGTQTILDLQKYTDSFLLSAPIQSNITCFSIE